MKQKQLQRILIIIFGVAFIGSTGVAIIGSLMRQPTPVASKDIPDNQNPQDQLQAEARGYEKVLAREPENTTALMSLLDIRLQTGDLQGAVTPLSRLVKMYPERKELADLLVQIEQQLAQQNSGTTDKSSSENK